MISILNWTREGDLLLEAQPSNGGPVVPVRLSQGEAEALYDDLQAALQVDPDEEGDEHGRA